MHAVTIWPITSAVYSDVKPNNNSIKFKNRRANLRFFARYFKGPIALCLNKRLSEATELTSGGWRSCPAGVQSSTRPP